MSRRAVIYLDQNKWIDLARSRASASKSDDGPWHKIERAKNDGRALFPMSFSTQYETVKINNAARRRSLAALQAQLSDGWVMKSRTSLLAVELEQALRRAFQMAPEPLSETWFLSQGLLDAFSSGQWAAMPPEVHAAVRERASGMSPQQQVMILLDRSDDESRRALVRKLTEASDTLIKNLERRRERLRAESREMRDRAYAARLLIDHMPLVEAGLRSIGKTWDDLRGLGDEMMRSLIDDAPTLNVERRMVDRLEALDRRVKENDLRDMYFMYCAAPYCHHIVAEKMFVTLGRQAGLEKLYGVEFHTNLESVADLL